MAKADSHLDKNGLNQSDVFLTSMDKGWSVVEKNRPLILGFIAALVLVGLGYVIYEFFDRRAERAASEELYKVEAGYLKAKEEFDRAKFESTSPPPPGEKPPEKPAQAASGDLQKDYGAAVEGFEKFLKERPKSAAGAQAALMLSDIYLEYKQPEKAVSALDQVTPHIKKGELLFGLTHMVRGTALATKGDCTQAVNDWQKVVETKQAAYLHPDALLKSGVCYENLKQTDKASEMYRRVTQDFADTAAAQTAKSLLRALEMKSVAPTPAPTAG